MWWLRKAIPANKQSKTEAKKLRYRKILYELSDIDGPAMFDPEKSCWKRFEDEAERMAHRKEIYKQRHVQEQLQNQFRQLLHENRGPRFEVVGPVGVVVNPHEMKIKAILAVMRGRVPIYATLPPRNGKRFRCFSSGPFSKITFV